MSCRLNTHDARPKLSDTALTGTLPNLSVYCCLNLDEISNEKLTFQRWMVHCKRWISALDGPLQAHLALSQLIASALFWIIGMFAHCSGNLLCSGTKQWPTSFLMFMLIIFGSASGSRFVVYLQLYHPHGIQDAPHHRHSTTLTFNVAKACWRGIPTAGIPA